MGRLPSVWFVASFAIVWVLLAVGVIFREYRRGERLNWMLWFAGSFVVLGALGYFGSALLSLGMIHLPPSIEWPAGYVDGVVTSQDGKYIVPRVPRDGSRYTAHNGIS
jgi:hypothetical protein